MKRFIRIFIKGFFGFLCGGLIFSNFPLEARILIGTMFFMWLIVEKIDLELSLTKIDLEFANKRVGLYKSFGRVEE